MNKHRQRKLITMMSVVLMLSLAAGLILYALKQNINLFYTPTQLIEAKVAPTQICRVGGYVKKNSVQFDASGQSVAFIVTDKQRDILVRYHGVLPNLFREGQGVVMTGQLNAEHVFIASDILAKHDEKYMPASVAKALQKIPGASAS